MTIWRENEQAYRLWDKVGDQWRVGPGGPIALDHGPLVHELERMSLQREAYDALHFDIRVMADEALSLIHKDS